MNTTEDSEVTNKAMERFSALLAICVFAISLILPARSINGVNYGIECFLFALVGVLTPAAWENMFHLYSLDSEMVWGGIVNFLFIGASILILSRWDREKGPRIFLSSIYALCLIQVAYYCRSSLLVGFYVWLLSHSLMVVALIYPCVGKSTGEGKSSGLGD